MFSATLIVSKYFSPMQLSLALNPALNWYLCTGNYFRLHWTPFCSSQQKFCSKQVPLDWYFSVYFFLGLDGTCGGAKCGFCVQARRCQADDSARVLMEKLEEITLVRPQFWLSHHIHKDVQELIPFREKKSHKQKLKKSNLDNLPSKLTEC